MFTTRSLQYAPLLLAVTLSAVCERAAGDTVHRRGSAPAITGTITLMDETGVSIRADSGAEHVMPWDRVRAIEMANPPRSLDQQLAAATELWRARTRVERGDTILAEPLFEKHFQHHRGKTSETALVVAEGLLRCRLARGENALAIVPALEVIRLRRAKIATDSYAMLQPVFDPATGLCPALPPVFVPSPINGRVGRELAALRTSSDPAVAALAVLYSIALGELQPSPASQPQSDTDEPGVRLLTNLLALRSATNDQRDGALRTLERQVASLPAWARAWVNYEAGLALASSDDIDTRARGLLQLLAVPAEHASLQPFLAGVALSRAADILQRRGDTSAATNLREELARSFPNHPVRAAEAARSPRPKDNPA